MVPTSRQLNIKHNKARYVFFPVWILNTKYKDKIYTFAMNGQTGKMTGAFPICPRRQPHGLPESPPVSRCLRRWCSF